MACLQLLAFLNLALINVKGAVRNESQLQDAINSLTTSPDIIAITESWMDASDTISLPNYTCWSNPEYKGIGGTAFLIHDRLSPVCTPATAPSDLEKAPAHNPTQWIRIINTGRPLYISLTYASPNDKIKYKVTLDELAFARGVLSKVGDVIHMGDFNNTETFYSNLFKNFAKGLINLFNKRCTEKNEHWTLNARGGHPVIDHILIPGYMSNNTYDYWVHQTLDCGSDHRLITASIKFNRLAQSTWGRYVSRKCNWTKTDKIKYQHTMGPGDAQLDEALSLPSSKDTIIYLAEMLDSVITKAFHDVSTKPYQHTRGKRKGTETHTHKHLFQHKNMLLNNLNDARLPAHKRKATWSEINKIQNQLSAEAHKINTDTNAIWWSALGTDRYPANPKGFWKYARKLKETSADEQSFPSVLIGADGTLHKGKDKVKVHIKHFYQEIAANKDPATAKFHESQKITPKALRDINKVTEAGYQEYEKAAALETTSVPNMFTSKDVSTAVKKQKRGKSPGDDELVTECLLFLPPAFRAILLLLYNMMFQLSYTPATWQSAVTILLFKKGDRMDINNYRPITLLRTILKVWEKLLTTTLTAATKGHYPPPSQFGCSKGTSAPMAILVLRAILRMAGELKLQVYASQIDLNKAYNRVNRKLLWAKLHKMGVPVILIKAIESTYTHCREATRLGSTLGIPYLLLAGLRQGSVLSPLLFILYTASLLEQLSALASGIPIEHPLYKFFNAIMFVDDLFTLATSLPELADQCNTVLQWALDNHSIVSLEKSSTTSSPLMSTQMDDIKTKLSILKHTTDAIHLGTKVNIEQMTNGYAGLGKDVGHRASKTQGILAIMSKRGLRNGAVAPLPGFHIITTTALTSLTYGLSSPHLTATDNSCLNNTISGAITELMGVPSTKGTAETAWLLHDAGITPPTTQIAINDCTALFLAKEGKADPIASAILPMDAALNQEVALFLHTINTLPAHVHGKHKKARSRFLKNRARQAAVNTLPPAAEDLCRVPHPILTRAPGLPPAQQRALLRARYFFAFPPTESCPFCPINEPHTVHHAVWRCGYPPLAYRRGMADMGQSDNITTILDAREGYSIAGSLPKLSAVLSLLSWSPVFYPRA